MKNRAFTLVELLVAIAVIAILTTILLTALASAKQKALTIECKSNLLQQGIMLCMYLNDNRNYPLATAGGSISIWQHATSTSDKDQTLYCPKSITPSEFYTMAIRSNASSILPHYGYNYIGSGFPGGGTNLGLAGTPNKPGITPRYKPLPESSVKAPSQMLCIGDGDDFIFPETNNTPPEMFLYFIFPFDVPEWGHIGVNDSHGGGANMLRCDFHVEYQKKTNWIAHNAAAMARWNNDNQPNTNTWR